MVFFVKGELFSELHYRSFWDVCHQRLTEEEKLTSGHVLKYALYSAEIEQGVLSSPV
jgi:hypothetical protein